VKDCEIAKDSNSLKLYYPFLNCAANYVEIKIWAAAMASKENDVFYLKLQWISAKDETERKKLSEKIRQVLSQQKK
jgi:hypothetical protein